MTLTTDLDAHLELLDAPAAIDAYPHQKTTWDKMDRHYLDERRPAGLVVLPTGGGKTVVAADWLLRNVVAKGGRVLWLANRQALLRQAFHTFKRLANVAYPEKKTLDLIAVSSEFSKWSTVSREHELIFASVQSSVLECNRGFVKELLADAGRNAFVVVDEAHHAVAPRTLDLLSEIKSAGVRLLGLTATPIRMDDNDQKRLGALFDGSIIHQVSRTELSNQGILAVPSTETVKTQINVEGEMDAADLKYLERYGELGPNVLARLGKNAHRNGLIVEQYLKQKDKYGPTIVFAADTLHAQTLAGEFQKRGVPRADYVDYSRRNASEIIDKYSRGELDVIVNVQMLTEGFDAPHTRTVFIARPTRSESLVVQMVGRALRGPRAGGNDRANLVTFLDTWSQYDVLGADYALDASDMPQAASGQQREDVPLVIIPPELIRDAYRLLQSSVKGLLTGVHACIPHGWYRWEEEFEDDVQSRTVMVFDTQREALDALLESDAAASAEAISEDSVRALIRRFFADVPDPLPRWTDVKALLEGRRKDCELVYITFDEKKAFDPVSLAKAIVEAKMDPFAEAELLAKVWVDNPACAIVYRQDEAAFREEVGRERTRRMNAALQRPKSDAVVAAIVPQGPPRGWVEGEPRRSLAEIYDAVVAVKRHFPAGPPMHGELRWMRRASKRTWGFFRYQDKCIALNPLLDSPDVPRFVVEFLLYHELLHGDMPSAGHNADFRARERNFVASPKAAEEARALGIEPARGSTVDFWRVRAEMFLDTFERYFQWTRPGTSMEM
jgi:superfamily II DNA or RNA helicase